MNNFCLITELITIIGTDLINIQNSKPKSLSNLHNCGLSDSNGKIHRQCQFELPVPDFSEILFWPFPISLNLYRCNNTWSVFETLIHLFLG